MKACGPCLISEQAAFFGPAFASSPGSPRIPGSPPRAWGQPSAPRSGQRLHPVHPHVRGDNRCTNTRTAIEVGSPPRAWGQRSERRRCIGRPWFTPTCVGTTFGRTLKTETWTVHPHVRGDNVVVARPLLLGPGSPPRAWGQPDRRREEVEGRPVHPHVRGDNWGWARVLALDMRFTPTCVGTTFESPARASERPVHPHVRGDNDVPSAPRRRSTGSPPRAWGQPCPGLSRQ